MFEESIELFMSFLVSNNRSGATIEQYGKELEVFFRFLHEKKISDINEVETLHIDLYQGNLMRKNKSATVTKKMNILRSFFKYLRGRKYIDENPMDAVNPVKIKDADRKKKESLTKDEAMRLIRGAEKNSIPTLRLRNKVLMMSFIFFGLRVSELCDLKVEDISFKDKTVYIIDGKGGKNRQVPLFDELVDSFKEYMKSKKVKSEYFFTTKQTDKPLKPRAVLDLVKRHKKKARINKNIGCHSLRRTAATLLYEDGFDPRVIQLFLGHSSLNTTMLYINNDIQKVNEEIRKGFSLAKELKGKKNKEKD